MSIMRRRLFPFQWREALQDSYCDRTAGLLFLYHQECGLNHVAEPRPKFILRSEKLVEQRSILGWEMLRIWMSVLV